MDEFITKLQNGEIEESEIKTLESKLSESGKNILKEALAFVTKRQDESTKVKEMEDYKEKLAADIKTEEEKQNALKSNNTQFRQEQVTKAKEKFFADYEIPAEKRDEYNEKFKVLDSGKVDPDLIYQDFVGVYAYLNKDTLVKAEKESKEMERKASEEAAKAANGGGSAPAGNEKPEFSKQATDLSKEAGIPEDAADRIVKQGMTRTLG